MKLARKSTFLVDGGVLGIANVIENAVLRLV